MHTSFEDLRIKLYNDQMNVPQEGSIGRFNDEGDLVWDRPRTRREAGIVYSRIVVALALGFAVASPLIVAMIFIMT